MPVQISKTLVNKLPESERINTEQSLWDKSGGLCWLCEEPLNRASDVIQADHEVPESEGGATDLANLNLAHASCNKAKRNAKTVPIRPYLKLVAFTKNNGGRLKYDGYVKHFEIEPKSVVVTRSDDRATFELPDGSKTTVPIFSEENTTGLHEYVFVTLPRNAIFNDDACQPRVVRTDHAWSIFCDLQRNVLHEPPSCRMEENTFGSPVKLLLFDGQHKTVASWMMNRKSVTTKIYLNMSTARANELVNSIQAKIKKLPLSPFELAGKMADEWENKFGEYESVVGASEVSESGFIAWLPTTERTRGKAALQAALIQNVLTSPDMRITARVKRVGDEPQPFGFTEQQLKAKVLEKLLVKGPLDQKGEEAQTTRDAEAANIVSLLNTLNDLAFEPTDDNPEMVPGAIERARRMSYQSSLAHISELLRKIWNYVNVVSDEKAPMAGVPDEARSIRLGEAIKRLVDHPVWSAGFDRDEKMAAVKVTLEKNQEGKTSFEAVGLDLGYLVLGTESTTYRAYWLSPS